MLKAHLNPTVPSVFVKLEYMFVSFSWQSVHSGCHSSHHPITVAPDTPRVKAGGRMQDCCTRAAQDMVCCL